MKLEREADGTRFICWMDTDEYNHLREHAPSEEHRLIVRLCGESGIRVTSVPEVRMENAERIRGESFIQIPNLRTQRGPNFRDVYLNGDLLLDLVSYQEDHGIADSEPLFDYTKRTIQKRIKTVAEATADATGNDDFRHVSSKDLRRYFATKLLFEDRVHFRVVMELGGWRQFHAMERYVPFPDRDEAFDELGLITKVNVDG